MSISPKSEWIESFDEGKAPFDDVRHEDMVVTTMSYNNGRMFPTCGTWKGVVKETGEELSIRGYAAFEWDGERVVGFYNAFDPTEYNGAEPRNFRMAVWIQPRSHCFLVGSLRRAAFGSGDPSVSRGAPCWANRGNLPNWPAG